MHMPIFDYVQLFDTCNISTILLIHYVVIRNSPSLLNVEIGLLQSAFLVLFNMCYSFSLVKKIYYLRTELVPGKPSHQTI